MNNRPVLRIATYHYVRDLPRTPFPKIKGMMLDDFQAQVDELSDAYQMASLECAIAFLKGEYSPKQDLCLLTFDDGLKEHFSEITPILASKRIQGIFHLITGCTDHKRVAPVHMNHFLMATLDFDTYRELFLHEAGKLSPQRLEHGKELAIACRTYPLDTPDVAEFKYFFNFALDAEVRDRAVQILFNNYLGEEEEFSRDLYVNWEEARAMQDAGMVIGGHTDAHRPLATLSETELQDDTHRCWTALQAQLHPQSIWPFCFPYGRRNSYSDAAIASVRNAGFDCAFTTEIGENVPGVDLYTIYRTDCNKAWPNASRSQSKAVSAL